MHLDTVVDLPVDVNLVMDVDLAVETDLAMNLNWICTDLPMAATLAMDMDCSRLFQNQIYNSHIFGAK